MSVQDLFNCDEQRPLYSVADVTRYLTKGELASFYFKLKEEMIIFRSNGD